MRFGLLGQASSVDPPTPRKVDLAVGLETAIRAVVSNNVVAKCPLWYESEGLCGLSETLVKELPAQLDCPLCPADSGIEPQGWPPGPSLNARQRGPTPMQAFDKDVLTTGEVAKICNVAARTVSKWFDSGQLNGYRIPGSKDRRIPVSNLVQFMRSHGIPMDGLMSGQSRVLVADSDVAVSEALIDVLSSETDYDLRTCSSAFFAWYGVRTVPSTRPASRPCHVRW